MRLRDSIKISFTTLRVNKMRSVLTMLGIVIGVASVIIMMSLGGGAQNLILGQIASMGSNNIRIEPGSPTGSISQRMIDQLGQKNLKYEDALAMAKDSNIEKVSANGLWHRSLDLPKRRQKNYLYGSWSRCNGYKLIYLLPMVRGIDEEDVKSMSQGDGFGL